MVEKMGKEMAMDKSKIKLGLLLIGWLICSLILFAANVKWNFNPNMTWYLALIGGAIITAGILLQISIIIDFKNAKNKLLYLVLFIGFVIMQLIIHSHWK